MVKFILPPILFILPLFSLAATTTVNIYPPSAYHGEAVVVEIIGETPLAATLDKDNIPLFPYANGYRGVWGVPLTKKPGVYTLKVDFAAGKSKEKNLLIRAKKFPQVVLEIPEKLKLTPSGLAAKLQTEKTSLAETFNTITDNVFFNQRFGLALADNRRIGSAFGEIRKSGGTEIRHLGTDFAAAKGAAVGAINAGVVRKAYFDSIYGNSVIVDHGRGIFSFYLHLDKIRVRQGELLQKGSLIGTVGDSGYATAPHLHLSVKIGGVAVDPLSLIRNFR